MSVDYVHKPARLGGFRGKENGMVNHPNRKRAAKLKVTATAHNHEHDYSSLLTGVTASFAAAVASGGSLFQTNAEGLFDLYLDSMPSERQVHNCHCCRRFIATYGGLVTIGTDGSTTPAMWAPLAVPEFYRPAFKALHDRVKRARVDAPFLSKEAVWGTPRTGDWTHPAVAPPAAFVYRERALTAGQAMAALRENYRTVATALGDFKPAMLDEALRLLKAEALARSEKFIGPVQWLRDLHDRPKGRAGSNVLWLAIAKAPEGYCHPRASVVGSLLDDIAAGLEFAYIKARFNAKLEPLIYQRPQAAPSAGNIKAAEALFEKLGLAPALERRFARLDEIQAIWRPAAAPELAPGGGVFAHLKAKGETVRPVDLPAVTMTWEKLARTILPDARALEFNVPSHGNFIAMTTAANPEAPPILKWDREDERNPVAWYVYHNGSPASQWRLAATWTKVNAVSAAPNQWGSKPMEFLGHGVVLVLDGAADTREGQGNAIFPECLKDDLHGARATIEAYSRSAKMGGRDAASACGYHVGKGKIGCSLRALVSGAWSAYTIDRWD